eukprot:6178496-Pleurochrysis_carterae.AAC.1
MPAPMPAATPAPMPVVLGAAVAPNAGCDGAPKNGADAGGAEGAPNNVLALLPAGGAVVAFAPNEKGVVAAPDRAPDAGAPKLKLVAGALGCMLKPKPELLVEADAVAVVLPAGWNGKEAGAAAGGAPKAKPDAAAGAGG